MQKKKKKTNPLREITGACDGARDRTFHMGSTEYISLHPHATVFLYSSMVYFHSLSTPYSVHNMKFCHVSAVCFFKKKKKERKKKRKKGGILAAESP